MRAFTGSKWFVVVSMGWVLGGYASFILAAIFDVFPSDQKGSVIAILFLIVTMVLAIAGLASRSRSGILAGIGTVFLLTFISDAKWTPALVRGTPYRYAGSDCCVHKGVGSVPGRQWIFPNRKQWLAGSGRATFRSDQLAGTLS